MSDEIEEDIVCGDKEDENDEEFEISCLSPDKEDEFFDLAVGALQETVIDPAFTHLQNKFMDEFCGKFEEKEENKLIYNEIFKAYIQTIEMTIEKVNY